MYVEFPLILGADYSCGHADKTIQAIRSAISSATLIGLILELHEDKGLVLGAYSDGNKFNESIIEVRDDGDVNLYGLLEFVFKDMMLFDRYEGVLNISSKPKPLMTFDEFDKYFDIEEWVYENDFDIETDVGKLIFISKETGEKLTVIDAQYANYDPPEVVDYFVSFVKKLFLELKKT